MLEGASMNSDIARATTDFSFFMVFPLGVTFADVGRRGLELFPGAAPEQKTTESVCVT
jgi:hypothetical protein